MTELPADPYCARCMAWHLIGQHTQPQYPPVEDHGAWLLQMSFLNLVLWLAVLGGAVGILVFLVYVLRGQPGVVFGSVLIALGFMGLRRVGR